MPSLLHQLLVELFRIHSSSVMDLLRKLDVQLPEYNEVRPESIDISDVKPAEYRADLVLFLVRESEKVLGVIVEVQLGRDEDKPYAWPAYIANLRARHRCPVCLLVLTTEEAVARWAGKTIELGPGTLCKPWVFGPSNTPIIAEWQHAAENFELSVLSAIEHRENPDLALVERIRSAAIFACNKIDDQRRMLYLDLINLSLPENIRQEIGAAMNSPGYETQSDFLRRIIAEGKAEGLKEGLKEGRKELILKQLTVRFGQLSAEIQTRVRGAQDADLDTVAERIMTAQTLEQALGSLC